MPHARKSSARGKWLPKEPAITVCKPDATMEPAPQNNQLLPKHRVLGLQPHLRLEWSGQDGQGETQKPDHSASLIDSVTSSTRITFSVHTPLQNQNSWKIAAFA